ncbi:hypothetical protein JCM18899A_53250 [Nocardioides sp. AN3]
MTWNCSGSSIPAFSPHQSGGGGRPVDLLGDPGGDRLEDARVGVLFAQPLTGLPGPQLVFVSTVLGVLADVDEASGLRSAGPEQGGELCGVHGGPVSDPEVGKRGRATPTQAR